MDNFYYLHKNGEEIDELLDTIEDIENILPTSTSTGDIDNAKPYKLMSVSAEGKYEQNTTEGKNKLITANNWVFDTAFNSTYEKTDTTVKVTATTASMYSGVAFKTIQIQAGETWTISMKAKASSTNFPNIRLGKNDNSVSNIIGLAESVKIGDYYYITYTFTAQENFVLDINFYADYRSSSIIGTVTYYDMQLEPGSSATPCEPYTGGIASPNPDYKQDIEVVNGLQLLKKGGLSTPKTDTEFWGSVGQYFTPLEDGWGKFYLNNTSNDIQYINAMIRLNGAKLEPNTEYTIIIEFRNIASNNAGLLTLSQARTDEVFPRNISDIQPTNQTYKSKVTTKASFTNVTLSLRAFGVIASQSLCDFEARISIFKGDYTSTDYSYVPYGNIGLNRIGKNIFVGNFAAGNWSSIVGEELVSYTNETQVRTANKIEVKPNTTYKFTIDGNEITQNTRYTYADENNIVLSSSTNTTGTITTPSNCKYVVFHGTELRSKYGTNIPNPMLEEGLTATTSKPYTLQTTPINLNGNTINALPSGIKDNLLIDKKGNCAIQRKVNKVVLDGSENDWVDGGTNSYGLKNYNKPLSDCVRGILNPSICNYFSPQVTLFAETQTEGYYINANAQLYLRIKSATASNLANFKSWLSTHPTEVYYELATPTIINLPKLTTLPTTVEGVNHIWLDTNLGRLNIEVKYVEDLQLEIDRINAMLGE